MVLQLFGTVMIAGRVGHASERSRFTRNGYVPSVILCVGGALLFYFTRIMFGLRFGAPGVDAIVSSVGARVIVPTRWRRPG